MRNCKQLGSKLGEPLELSIGKLDVRACIYERRSMRLHFDSERLYTSNGQVPSHVMLGTAKHETAKHEDTPQTPQLPLSQMGEACLRMDLTAIHQILVVAHYKDDTGNNEVCKSSCGLSDLPFFLSCISYTRLNRVGLSGFETLSSCLFKSGPSR